MQHVFETPGTVRLKISIGAGDVHIETADRVATEVELHALNRAAEEVIGEMTVRCDEHIGVWTVVVEEPKRGILSSLFNSAEIGVRVRCPRDVDVEVQTGSADVRLQGDVSSAIAKTGSGDLGFDDVRGDLEVSSASGDVAAGERRRRLRREDRLGRHPRDERRRRTRGEPRLGRPRGPRAQRGLSPRRASPATSTSRRSPPARSGCSRSRETSTSASARGCGSRSTPPR